jgi:hypothetical protein
MAENFFPKKEDTKVRVEFSGLMGNPPKKPACGITDCPKPTQLFGNESKKGKK